MKITFLIGLAGLFGALSRFYAVRIVHSLLPGFPWGTLFVNVIGAFLAGFLFVLCRTRFQAYEAFFPILFVGFLGAFTTFSTFALESARYLLDSQYAHFWGNILLQNISGLLAAYGGLWMGQIYFSS